jgi:hypothetical protein
MANTIAPVISGISQPGLDFSPQPNVKYTLKNTPNVLNTISCSTFIFILSNNIYFLTNEPTLSQPRIPHITVSSTQGTRFYRLLTNTVSMLRLNLLWLCDLWGLHNLGGSH